MYIVDNRVSFKIVSPDSSHQIIASKTRNSDTSSRWTEWISFNKYHLFHFFGCWRLPEHVVFARKKEWLCRTQGLQSPNRSPQARTPTEKKLRTQDCSHICRCWKNASERKTNDDDRRCSNNHEIVFTHIDNYRRGRWLVLRRSVTLSEQNKTTAVAPAAANLQLKGGDKNRKLASAEAAERRNKSSSVAGGYSVVTAISDAPLCCVCSDYTVFQKNQASKLWMAVTLSNLNRF